ncbi:MAG: hypothetical protein HYV40_05150 [Candidatus Levybacteria bacterium]|nr:hypothetical protein [Candidatus Levybacteria bacterium]
MQEVHEREPTVSPEGAEIISHIPIGTLFVLVHPLDAQFGSTILYNKHTRRARNTFCRAVFTDFLPRSPKDVLVVIPNSGPSCGDFKRFVRAVRTVETLFPNTPSGLDLYKQCKRETAFKDNVLLGENIAREDVSSHMLERRLSGRGFAIMSDTAIIIAGEYTEGCVEDATIDLLTLPQVQHVFIDRQKTLGQTEYTKHQNLPQTSFEALRERLRSVGYLTTLEGTQYLKVMRP